MRSRDRRQRGLASRALRFALGASAVLFVVALVSGFLLWRSLPDVRPLAKSPPETTAFIELRRAQAMEGERPFRLRWRWRALGRISPYLRHAVISAEDARFWKHEGVDWGAVKQAARHNWEQKRLEIGASTITQQVAKNLYLSPSRNPIRKLRELFIARRLERHLSKRRLLEIYLNIAEWGDGVFGAEAAARRWYGCSAAELRPAQAARLAVALPNPRRRSPAEASPRLDRKAERLVRAMRRDGLLDREGLARALRDLSRSRRTAER